MTKKKIAAKKRPVKKAAPLPKKAAAKKAAPARKPAPAPAPQLRKPAKSEPLTKQEISSIATSLVEMKADLARNVEDKKLFDLGENDGGDSIDLATKSLEKEILFELSDNERKMMADIEAALRKMEKGTYGLCEHCKQQIDKKRIKALPSARYCMTCQSGTEMRRSRE